MQKGKSHPALLEASGFYSTSSGGEPPGKRKNELRASLRTQRFAGRGNGGFARDFGEQALG